MSQSVRFHLPRSSARRACTRAGFLAFAAMLASSSAAAQGETGFLRGKGKADVVLSYTIDTYDKFWFGDDRLSMPGVGEVNRETYTLYTAYGLNDRTDLILKGSYVRSESDGAANFPTESDFQDLTLAAKYRFWERTFQNGSELSVAALPGIKLPMTDYQNNAVTALGDGQIDLQFRVVGQYRLSNGVFAALETGYDRRNGSPKDEIPINLTVGGTIANRLTLSAFLTDIDSLGGTDLGPPGTNYFPANEEDLTRTGLSAYYRINDSFGLAGSWRTTLDGRNTGDVEGFSIGLVYRVH